MTPDELAQVGALAGELDRLRAELVAEKDAHAKTTANLIRAVTAADGALELCGRVVTQRDELYRAASAVCTTENTLADLAAVVRRVRAGGP
jgi:hypothetical protein